MCKALRDNKIAVPFRTQSIVCMMFTPARSGGRVGGCNSISVDDFILLRIANTEIDSKQP